MPGSTPATSQLDRLISTTRRPIYVTMRWTIEEGGTFVRAHTAVAFGRARYPLGAVCRDQVLDLALGRTREIEA